jgi:ubiquinone/menaquinone biosynthesis C-methylase UbiE
MRAAWERFYETRRRPWAGAVELPDIPEGSLVLETGCGGGRLLGALARGRPGLSVVGTDLSRASLLPLAAQFPGALLQADIAALPFRDGSFDAVLCRHVLGHLPGAGRKAAAAEMMRVVKPGGTVFFEGFSTDDARFGKGRGSEPATFVRGDGIWHHYFTKEEVSGLFPSASRAEIREKAWEERAGRARMRRAVLVAELRRPADSER